MYQEWGGGGVYCIRPVGLGGGLMRVGARSIHPSSFARLCSQPAGLLSVLFLRSMTTSDALYHRVALVVVVPLRSHEVSFLPPLLSECRDRP